MALQQGVLFFPTPFLYFLFFLIERVDSISYIIGVLRAFYAIFQIILQKSTEIGTVTVPISWMGKLSQREVMNSCQVAHPAGRL